MVIFDPDEARARRLSPPKPYRVGVLHTLETVYEKAHQTESIEDFRKWIAIQLSQYEEE